MQRESREMPRNSQWAQEPQCAEFVPSAPDTYGRRRSFETQLSLNAYMSERYELRECQREMCVYSAVAVLAAA